MNTLPLSAVIVFGIILVGGSLVLGWRTRVDFDRGKRGRAAWQLVGVAFGVLFAALTFWTTKLPVLRGSAWSLKDMLIRAGAIVSGVFFLIALLTALLPWLLDRLEGRTFSAFVAARHVRSQKSGFLTVISVLSICGVALSSCALSSVVSVMGGFSHDLKRKILGNNAHIVIDTTTQTPFTDYEAILADWFEHASFGIAMLTVTPLTGVYAAVRLVLPIAPGWVLQSIGIFSLITAVYAAAMATVQREERRFFAYLFLSLSSMVLVGLEIHTELSLCGSLCLWFSMILSLGGFGLTLRALEGRFGRLSLTRHHGLYEHSPTLAVCFMLTGLACIGFPFTLGFISVELLVESVVDVNPFIGVGVVAASALNGIAVLRAYFLLFTGARHQSAVSLGLGVWERFAVLTLAALILGGGLFPQPGVTTRLRAAQEIIAERAQHITDEKVKGPTMEDGVD